ncbi:MAG: hypothetical protein HY814_13050 [Candidatus Riflebacteria bacterium]|nr:hypothetical protein [Candidatus Riflebacteria bacterium]
MSASPLEARKVTMNEAAIRKATIQEPATASQDVTAGIPTDSQSAPAVRPSPAREPLKYDALPEKERKRHALDEILKAFVEV